MRKRWLPLLGFLTGVAGLIALGVLAQLAGRPLIATGPWYFDQRQCEARLLGKTPAEVEREIGQPPSYFGRPRKDHPELDESSWPEGVAARSAWHCDWGSITVEFDDQDRAVYFDIWRYQAAPGLPDHVTSRRP